MARHKMGDASANLDDYSARTGRDSDGNRYRMNASEELVMCETPDGRIGWGWTPDDSLRDALMSNDPSSATPRQ